MARDYFDESKKKKTTTQKAATKPKSQSSSVAKPKATTSKATKAASKSTFLGGGASTQKVQQANKKPSTVKKPATTKKTVTQQERINQKMYGSPTAPERRTKAPTTNTQRKTNAEANLNLKQTVAQTSRTRTTLNDSERRTNRDANLNLKQTQIQRSTDARQERRTERMASASQRNVNRDANLNLKQTQITASSRQNKELAKEDDRRARQNQKSGIKSRNETLGIKESATGLTIEGSLRQSIGGHLKSIGDDSNEYQEYKDMLDDGVANGRFTRAEANRALESWLKHSNRFDRYKGWENTKQHETYQKIFKKGEEIYDKGTQQVQSAQEGAGRLKKAYLGALGSGVGMATDMAAGPAWMAAMASRTYGGEIGNAEKEGATRLEDRRYAGLQALKEVGTEGMFSAIGLSAGLLKGRGLFDSFANRLTGRVGESGIRSALRRYGMGIAEENLEEVAGWALDPAIKNLSYGNALWERQSRQTTRDEGDELRNAIASMDENSVRAMAAHLNSNSYLKQISDEMIANGATKEEASKMALAMQGYMNAVLSNNKEAETAYEDRMVDLLKGNNPYKAKLSPSELWDTLSSTTLLTGVTGLGGAVSTAAMGNAIKESNGLGFVKSMSDVVKLFDIDNSVKGQAVSDHIAAGNDVAGTQVSDIADKFHKVKAEGEERYNVSNQLKDRNMKRENLLIQPRQQNPDGTYSLGKVTDFAYDEYIKEALDFIENSDLDVSQEDAEQIADAYGAYKTGVINPDQMFVVNTDNPVARTIFSELADINFDSFTVRDRKGNVDIARTNIATENALYAKAADNYLGYARLEQENWNDEARGQVQKAMSERGQQTMSNAEKVDGHGDIAMTNALETVDPRDRGKFMLMATAASNVYNDARYRNIEWDEAKYEYKEMYKGLDQSALKEVFDAAKTDKINAENKNYGIPVKSGNTMNKQSLQDVGPVRVPGKVIDMRNDQSIKLSEKSLYYTAAPIFGTDFTLVDDLPMRDAQGKVVYRNIRTGEKINEDKLASLNEAEQQMYEPVQLEGSQSSTGIVLNTNAGVRRNIEDIAKHETIHQIRTNAPEQFKQLARYLQDKLYSSDSEGFMNTIKAKQEQYKAAGQDLTVEGAMEELIAEGGVNLDWEQLIEDIQTDPNIQEKRTLLESIRDAFREVIAKLRAILSSGNVVSEEAREATLDEMLRMDEGYKLLVKAAYAAKADEAQMAIDEWQDKANKQNAPRLSVTDSDADYIKAVEAGDMETAQRMVDEAARNAGYNYKAYRGGKANVFQKERKGNTQIGTFFTSAEYIANAFASGNKDNVGSYYLKMDDPLTLDAEGNSYVDIPVPDDHPDKELVEYASSTYDGTVSADDMGKWADAHGYDGVIINNVKEGIGGDAETDLIAINPEQTKSADPVTYDDNGNVIPLSERFNQGSPDIRYSLSEEDMTSLNEEGVDLTESGSAVRYSLESWQDTDIEALKEKLRKAGFDDKRIDKWIKDVNSIAALITGDMARLNYTADQFQDALKPNAEYFYTLDLSTLCQKRRLYQGTYNKIMRYLVNNVLLPEDTVRLRAMMDEMGYQVPCGICYEESRKKNEGKFAERWLNGYGKKWKGYKNQEHTDPYIPTLYEVTTTEGREKLREEHPEAYESYVKYQKTRGSANPKISYTHTDYRGDILRMTDGDIQKVKHIGGLRIQSFSDFEIPHVIDMMQAVMDMSAQKLTAQAYTKVPAFAKIFGGTGIKINLSLIGRYNPETDQLEFDAKEGIDPEEAFKLRDKYSKNVGTILVGSDDVSILKAWADPRVDMVIPFHRSGWSKKEFEKLGLIGYKDYTKGQTERYMMGKKDMALSTASKALGLAKEDKLEPIYSADYWDENLSGKENAERYLALCAEKHYRPVFYQFLHDNDDGTWSLQEDESTDGYWKSLIDFKMYDNEGNFAPQELVQPTFDMDEAKQIMDEYEGGADTLPVADDVVEAFLKEYKDNHPKAKFDIPDNAKLSISVEMDDAYMDAVNSGNMDEAQRLVGEAAKMAGFDTPLFHGTDAFGFTTIDNEAPGADGFSFWAASREDASATYTLYGKRRNISDRELSEEEQDAMYDEVSNEIDDAISEFRYLVDNTFSEWVFGQQDNSYLRSLVDEANPQPGSGDGVYDVLSEIVFDAYHDYGMDSEMEFEDWSEETEEGSALWDAVNNIEALRGKLADIENGEIKGGIYGLYANTDNLYVLDAEGKAWNELRPKGLPELTGYTGVGTRPYKTRDVANWARENGYDGVRFKNIKDNGPFGRTLPFDVYAFFKPQEQVKSSDTITYAEDGSVIPLSERFDPTNNDIRYSLPTQDADGKILTDGQMEYFKNSQARDIFGRLVPVYHATDMGGFTIFDPWKSDDHRSLFFSNRRDAANTYVEDKYLTDEDRLGSDENNGGQTGYYQAYLNLENPLIIEGHGQPWNDIVDGGSVFPAYSSITLRNRSWFEDEAESRDKMYELGQSLYNGDNARERVQEFEGDDYVEIEIFNGKKKIKAIIPLTEEAVAEEAAAAFGVDDIELLQGVASEIVGDMGFGNITKIYDTDMRNTIGEYGYDTREWAEFAEDEGYDGVIFKNIVDIDDKTEMFDSDEEAVSDIYVAFSSNQVKDTRNENPTENPDIRYSIVDEDEAMSHMAHDYAYDTSYEALAYYEDLIAADASTEATYEKAKNYIAKDVDEFYAGLTRYADGMKFDDPVLEEGRTRMAKSKQDYFNSNVAKWNDAWLTDGEVLDTKSIRKAVRDLVMANMMDSDTDRKYKTELVDKMLIDMRLAYFYAKQGRTDVADALLWHSAFRMVDGVGFYNDDGNYETYKKLRDYFKDARLRLGEEYWNDTDYAAFRKRNYGKLNLVKGETNIDKIFGDLYEVKEDGSLGGIAPEFFTPEAFEQNDHKFGSVPDTLLQIEDVLLDLEPYAKAYSSEYCAEWATDIAADLLDIMQNGKELQSIADRYTNKYEAKIKAMKARHAEAMLKVRQQRDEGIKREKAKFKEYKEQQKEKRAHNKSFESIQKTHKKLTERLLTNTADKNIPEQYKRDLARLLAAFDLQTVGSKKYEARTGRQGQKTIKMAALKTALTNIENKSHEFHVSDAITDIIDELLGKDAGNGYGRSIEGLTIDELSASELDRIDKLLKALLHEFNTYKNVKIGAKRQQTEDIGKAQVDSALEHAKMFGAGKDYQNIPGGIDRIINLDEVTPAYMFKHIDPEKSGLGLMFKELRRSFDKYVKNQEQLNEWMDDIVGKYHKRSKLPWKKYGAGELENWRSENYAQTFNLENGPVTLTPAQMMSLYCLSKRTQAYNHMTGAGIVVAPVSFNAKIMSDLKKKPNTALPVKLTDADIKQIVAQLTPDQIKVAEDLQQLMANRMAAWGNEASMNVLGIELFGEPDYFPIKSDKAALEKDLNENEFVEAIRNFGFTKAVQPGARNAIMVDDIFNVVTEHCNNMNLYNAYSEAINDFMKVYNYRDFRDDGSEYTVQQAIAHAYGSKATTFIMTFMRDLNGNVSGRASGIENLYNSLLGNAKKAAVFANLRVAAQQPTAITRAFAVIDPKYLKGIKIENGAMDELFEHCPIALWKSWGYYDINMGKSIEDIMMNNGRWLEDAATELYGALDNVTWTAIWQMVKAEMKDTHPDVKVGSDEYWELCNERMTEVVDLTQVVDSPFHRSHAMRDKGIFIKAATSFMAEPTLTFNMLRDGVMRSREAWKKGDKAEAAKIAARIGAVALLQAATVAGAASLVDALRKKRPDKDDEDERFLHLWWVNALENFHDELKVWNKIYFVKDIASIFDGWDNSNLALQGIQKFALGYRQLTGDPYARSSATWHENMADGIGYMTGVPVKTVRTGLKNAMTMLGVSVSALDSVNEKLDSVSLKNEDGETGMIGKLLGLVLSDDEDSLLDKYAEKKGYKKVEKSDEDTGSEKTSESGETEEIEKREQLDYDTMLNKALKAAEGYEGEEYNQRIYSSVAQGMKGYIADGDYVSIGMMRTVIEQAGGDVNYFDQRVMEETKSAYKKSLNYDMSYEERWDQKAMYRYMMQHGMTQEELSSEVLYKSDLAKDMKVAYRIGDNDIIYEAMVPLVDAGMTQTDLERLYENRNRMDLTKYKQNGRYKDKLKSMGTFIWPTDGVITSHFGYRNAPTAGASSNHPAIDIGAPQGTAVVAADGGVIIYAGTNSGYGNSVGIKHDNGMVTYYNHLYAYNVKVGDTVAQGQQIAQVGSTGISTGPHLDFKIMDTDGKPVDPEKYLGK